MKYGDLLPDEIIKKNADFCLYYAWILIIAGQIQKAEPLLEFALKITNEKILDKKSEKQEVENYRKLLGKIAVAFAHLNSNQHKPEKILVYCLTAMENLSDNDPLWLGWAWNYKSVEEVDKGKIKQGIEALIIAVEYGKKSDNLYLISSSLRL